MVCYAMLLFHFVHAALHIQTNNTNELLSEDVLY